LEGTLVVTCKTADSQIEQDASPGVGNDKVTGANVKTVPSAHDSVTAADDKAKVKPDKGTQSSKFNGLRRIEVHEMFDREDLENKWHVTFTSKNYYVWLPSDKAKRRYV
jgi:hypothetical protein